MKYSGYELNLGRVLKWPITSKSTLQQGLYQYDALGRLQDHKLGEPAPQKRPQDHKLRERAPKIGKYLKLGPLGTALLPTERPRALLIDEIDKSDIDLPNDLLNIFEEGEFTIPELARLKEETVVIREDAGSETFPVTRGHIECRQFPFVVLTSNGEREFPPAFLRRCLRLEMPTPDATFLADIVRTHFDETKVEQATGLIEDFLSGEKAGKRATDQLLNAAFLILGRDGISQEQRESLKKALLRELSGL